MRIKGRLRSTRGFTNRGSPPLSKATTLQAETAPSPSGSGARPANSNPRRRSNDPKRRAGRPSPPTSGSALPQRRFHCDAHRICPTKCQRSLCRARKWLRHPPLAARRRLGGNRLRNQPPTRARQAFRIQPQCRMAGTALWRCHTDKPRALTRVGKHGPATASTDRQRCSAWASCLPTPAEVTLRLDGPCSETKPAPRLQP